MFNQKIKLNIDKLELTYSMPTELRETLGERDYWQCGEYGDVELHRTENRHYKNQFSIQVGGIVIGEIFFDPLNRFRQKIYVSVRNTANRKAKSPIIQHKYLNINNLPKLLNLLETRKGNTLY